MSRFYDDDEGMGIAGGLALMIMGVALGMIIIMVARSCDREAMPQVVSIVNRIDCQHCHGVKLNNAKRYAKYWQARRSVDHTRLVSAKDDDAENERMVQLIVGGKP